MQEHVLDKQPDLVFVEFSVNDSSSPLFMETYESLVRRLLKAESVKAVVLINNLFTIQAQMHRVYITLSVCTMTCLSSV